MNWNIWNIKSRALRAIVAWLFAGSAAVVVLLALPVALVWCVGAGAWAEGRAFFGGLTRGWGSAPSSMWRAMTGKEAV